MASLAKDSYSIPNKAFEQTIVSASAAVIKDPRSPVYGQDRMWGTIMYPDKHDPKTGELVKAQEWVGDISKAPANMAKAVELIRACRASQPAKAAQAAAPANG